MASKLNFNMRGKIATPSNEKARIQVDTNLEITGKQESELLDYVKARLELAVNVRDNCIDRYKSIDRHVACYLKLDDDDLERERDNDQGLGVKPVDVSIPLALSQLDEAVTYLLSVMAPEDGIYNAIAPLDQQDIAKGFASLMNKHAEDWKHYSNYALAFFEMMKYNLGGFVTEWQERQGTKINNDGAAGAAITLDSVVVADGNEVLAFDPYNTLFDPSVPPTMVAEKGEFFAQVEVFTNFALKRMENVRAIYGWERAKAMYDDSMTYYEERPAIRANRNTGETNWLQILTNTRQSTTVGVNEVLYTYIWLVPAEHGLGEETTYSIWRITSLSDVAILRLQRLTNAHGVLPISVGMPWDDRFGLQTKSYGEHLLPYQKFSSFQLNVHQRSNRKKLYGLTVYDKHQVPLLEQADLLGGKVPANGSSQDRDLRKSVVQFNDAPDTSNTLRDIEAMDQLMQKILPTDILKQVASLERATQYQAAATVQGANRRNLKMAKLIDAQCMQGCRAIQLYNILQYQTAVTIFDQTGAMVEIDPKEFRETELKFVITDGLKGLDKLLIIESMKDVLSWILQSQDAAARINVVELINYWTTLLGDNTDFAQFAYKTEFDKLTPEQKDLAFQLLQQAAAAQQGGGQPQGAQA